MRKCSLPPELANLSQAHLDQLHDWLDRFTYDKVQQLFRDLHGVLLGKMKLCRYNQRRLKARALGFAAQPPLTAADLVAIKNGTPLPDERLNKDLLLYRTLQLARGHIKSAYELRELHQIATYEQRLSFHERELDLEQRRAANRARRAELRQDELEFQKYLHARRAQLTKAKLENTLPPGDV